MKTQFACLAVALLLIAAPAHAEDTSYKSETSVKTHDDGGYEAKEKVTNKDDAGTVRKRETKKTVDADSDGNKETTVRIKSSNDPKGLFNKTTTEVENKAVEKNGKTEYSHTKKIDGKTVEETNEVNQPAD